ncbi:MAG: hypothetical protein Q9227_004908 [Pyrenula ochraceoflavens]
MVVNTKSSSLPLARSETDLLDRLGTDIVTVLVGRGNTGGNQQPTKFTLHQKLICSLSPFFEAAINGDFKESSTKEVRLPDIHVKAFDLLMSRLYEGNLPSQLLCEKPDEAKGVKYPDILSDYYHLADKLLLPDHFKIEALDSFIEQKRNTHVVSGAQRLRSALQDTIESDPIQRLLMDIAAYELIFAGGEGKLEKWFSNCSAEQKEAFVRSMVFVTANYQDPKAFNNKQTHFQKVLNFEKFTSVANMPRYQVGFLSKTTHENGEK